MVFQFPLPVSELDGQLGVRYASAAHAYFGILRITSDCWVFSLSSGKVEENHGCIRATEGEVYIRSGRKELGLEGASRCYIWDGDWVITHVPRDKPYGRHSCLVQSPAARGIIIEPSA
jgi:hypothetical protein